MAILGMWTADLQDLGILFASIGDSISSDYARTGTYSFKNNGGTNTLLTLFNTTSSTVYGRVAIYATSISYITICLLYPSAVNYSQCQCSIKVEGSLLSVNNNYNGSLLDSQTIDFLENAWNIVEFYITISDTTGVVQVKFNNDLIINLSNQDTRYSATYDTVAGLGIIVGGTACYIDDMMARDDDWCGLGGLYVLVPNAGSTNENWTASAGNPEECVDELPVSFTDYVYTDANTPDTEHLFGIASLPITPISIGGVGVFCKAQSDQNSDGDVRTLIKSGTTTSPGTAVLINTSPIWIFDYYAVNPDDSAAWENADIDAVEIGVETQ